MADENSSLQKWLAGLATLAIVACAGMLIDDRMRISSLETELANMRRDRIADLVSDIAALTTRASAHEDQLLKLRLKWAAWDGRWKEYGQELNEEVVSYLQETPDPYATDFSVDNPFVADAAPAVAAPPAPYLESVEWDAATQPAADAAEMEAE